MALLLIVESISYLHLKMFVSTKKKHFITLEHPRDMPNPYMEVEDPILDSVLKLFLDEVSAELVSVKIISLIDQFTFNH